MSVSNGRCDNCGAACENSAAFCYNCQSRHVVTVPEISVAHADQLINGYLNEIASLRSRLEKAEGERDDSKRWMAQVWDVLAYVVARGLVNIEGKPAADAVRAIVTALEQARSTPPAPDYRGGLQALVEAWDTLVPELHAEQRWDRALIAARALLADGRKEDGR